MHCFKGDQVGDCDRSQRTTRTHKQISRNTTPIDNSELAYTPNFFIDIDRHKLASP